MKRTIHLHIPKSAGSTFNKCLKYYAGKDVYRVKGHFNFSYPLPAEAVSKQIIVGHIDMRGITEYFTQPEEIDIICFLRHPIDRIISGYYNILRDPTNPAHYAVKEMDLLRYVGSDLVPDVTNGQVRRMSRAGARKDENIQIDHTHYQEAIELMQQYNIYAGTSENFDESLLLLTRDMGWKMPRYLTVNRGKNKSRKQDKKYMNQVLHTIAERNEHDLALFAYVQRQVTQRGTISTMHMRYFHWLNYLYYWTNVPQMIKTKYFQQKS